MRLVNENHPKADAGQEQKTVWEMATHERVEMVAEFHAWLAKKRIETEKKLLNNERHVHEIAPFASTALRKVEASDNLPYVVLEFAGVTLESMRMRRDLDLLNVYYRQAAQEECTESLSIEANNEADMNRLWDWFTEDRGE